MNILLDIFLWKVLLQISFGILILGFLCVVCKCFTKILVFGLINTQLIDGYRREEKMMKNNNFRKKMMNMNWKRTKTIKDKKTNIKVKTTNIKDKWTTTNIKDKRQEYINFSISNWMMWLDYWDNIDEDEWLIDWWKDGDGKDDDWQKTMKG